MEMYLDAEGVERERAERGDVEVQDGEPERLHPGDHPEQLPRPPRRHHPDAGVRLHQGHLDVRRPGAVVGVVPRWEEAHVLRVREEPRERGPRRVVRRRSLLALIGARRRGRGRGRDGGARRWHGVTDGQRLVLLLRLRQERALLRLQGLQQLLELLDEIDGAADNGCLVALHIHRIESQRQSSAGTFILTEGSCM